MNLAVLLVNTYATSVEVFLRHGMGTRYLGLQAVGVLLLVPAHAAVHPQARGDGLLLFLGLYLLACLGQRIGMLVNHWRGVVVHSRYSGFPRLLSPSSRIDELVFKTWIEPVVISLIGLLVWYSVDRLLGTYLWFAAASLHMKGRISNLHESTQRLDLRDAALEQQYRAEQFRQEQNGLLDALRGRRR